jgi:hypothetical protein
MDGRHGGAAQLAGLTALPRVRLRPQGAADRRAGYRRGAMRLPGRR